MPSNFEPRPSVINFTSKPADKELYAAPAMENDFAKNKEAKIDAAYKNQNGDVLFYNSNNHSWYIIPKEQKGACSYLLESGGINKNNKSTSQDNSKPGDTLRDYTVPLLVDSTIKDLNVDAEGKAFLQNRDATSPEKTKLDPLTLEERSALLQSCQQDKITFVGLPHKQQFSQGFQLPNNEFLIITTSGSEETKKAYKGKNLKSLQETPIYQHPAKSGIFYQIPEGELSLRFGSTSFSWQSKNSTKTEDVKEFNRFDIEHKLNPHIFGIETWQEHLDKNKKPEADKPKDKSSSSVIDPDLEKALSEYSNRQNPASISMTALSNQKNQVDKQIC